MSRSWQVNRASLHLATRFHYPRDWVAHTRILGFSVPRCSKLTSRSADTPKLLSILPTLAIIALAAFTHSDQPASQPASHLVNDPNVNLTLPVPICRLPVPRPQLRTREWNLHDPLRKSLQPTESGRAFMSWRRRRRRCDRSRTTTTFHCSSRRPPPTNIRATFERSMRGHGQSIRATGGEGKALTIRLQGFLKIHFIMAILSHVFSPRRPCVSKVTWP